MVVTIKNLRSNWNSSPRGFRTPFLSKHPTGVSYFWGYVMSLLNESSRPYEVVKELEFISNFIKSNYQNYTPELINKKEIIKRLETVIIVLRNYS